MFVIKFSAYLILPNVLKLFDYKNASNKIKQLFIINFKNNQNTQSTKKQLFVFCAKTLNVDISTRFIYIFIKIHTLFFIQINHCLSSC